MGLSIHDLLSRRTDAGFFGRADELAALGRLLEDSGPIVLHLHGIGGIGKTRLLETFAAQAQAGDAVVVRLDCRTIEPTERSFLTELCALLGAPAPTLTAVAQRLGALGHRVVLALDTYEVFRLLDAWLRQVFIPSLDAHVRILLIGREPPAPAWSIAPGWQGLFRSLALGPLGEDDARALLLHAGLDELDARRINRFTHGHPLALKLAAAAASERPGIDVEVCAIQRVVAELTRLYLSDIHDPLTRRALQAAAVVRRATISLLRAMLPDAVPQDVYERLATLPIVERRDDGLLIHDVVRQAIAAELKAADPVTYRTYRRAAWQQLRTEVQLAGRAELWRYTADMLYLAEAPTVREGFFPSSATAYVVEPAGADDHAAIHAICLRHDGPRGAELIDHWWARAPQAFYVARGRDSTVVGFYCLFSLAQVTTDDLRADPVLRAWWQHLRHHPVDQHEQVLFERRRLALDQGRPSAEVLAALTLDIKRAYMELRPQLRRLYTIALDLATYHSFLARLGFRLLPEYAATIDGQVYHVALLDFGPGSVDGWLANLVAAELTSVGEEAVALDVDAHELVVDGQPIGLTQLEFGVMQYLVEREGKAVSRGDLLEDVWGYSYDGGSNVVDVVVRALRKKLGVRAATIETVTKIGYRFRRPER